jgi:hypothetical protein
MGHQDAGDPAETRRATDVTTVWVCVYEHEDGIDVWVCRSEDLAFGELAKVCREFWAEAREIDERYRGREGWEALPEAPPASDRATVDLYFGAMGLDDPPEWHQIDAHTVVGVAAEVPGHE